MRLSDGVIDALLWWAATAAGFVLATTAFRQDKPDLGVLLLIAALCSLLAGWWWFTFVELERRGRDE